MSQINCERGGDFVSYRSGQELIPETDTDTVTWQDTLKKFLVSKGVVILSNFCIFIVMLFYCYTAKPADPDEIKICKDYNWTSQQTIVICQDAFKGLINEQQNSIGQRISTLVVVGLPIILYILCEYTQNLGVVVRAFGIKPNWAAVSTILGLSIFAFWVIRACYCFSNFTSKYAFCAVSKQPSFRIMNNFLIQLGLMVLSTFLLIIISEVLSIKDISSVWYERYSNIKNGVYFRECKKNIIYLFNPPPYAEVVENNNINNC